MKRAAGWRPGRGSWRAFLQARPCMRRGSTTCCRGRWRDVFGNDAPIYLEIGCGKGRFITGCAAAHPERNYIAIEGQSNVALRALEKAAANIRDYHTYHSYVEENTKYIIEGLVLALQSEQIIFQALRTHKINGESEEMDRRINSFLLGQARHSLHSFDNTASIYNKQEDKQ